MWFGLKWLLDVVTWSYGAHSKVRNIDMIPKAWEQIAHVQVINGKLLNVLFNSQCNILADPLILNHNFHLIMFCLVFTTYLYAQWQGEKVPPLSMIFMYSRNLLLCVCLLIRLEIVCS